MFFYNNPKASWQMSDISPNIPDQASSIIKATETYQWTLTAYEDQGSLWLSWQTNAPFRAAQGQIAVYSGQSFPSNPQNDVKVKVWDTATPNPWDTKQTWGKNWHCAWIAETGALGGPYVYVVRLVTKD
jgi:hypothetical protein